MARSTKRTTDLKQILASQYRAALAMLRDAIVACPDDLWLDAAPRNAAWQLAYHVLFFTDLYLAESDDAFVPWAHQQAAVHVDGIPGPEDGAPEDAHGDVPWIPEPYERSQVLAYLDDIESRLSDAIEALDLTRLESGFPWYPISKLEHQFVNLRHLQHHTAQLMDRVRNHADVGVGWYGAMYDGE